MLLQQEHIGVHGMAKSNAGLFGEARFFLASTLVAARWLFDQAIASHGAPEKITIDIGGANTAAIDSLNDASLWNSFVRRSSSLQM